MREALQFSIRRMLFATATVAVGCSIGCLKTEKWEEGVLAAAATWIIVGLSTQIVDLARVLREATDLTLAQRTGWWFAIVGRAGLAILLAGHFLLDSLLATKRVVLVGDGEPFGFGPLGYKAVRDAIFAFSLIIVFSDPNNCKRPTRFPWWSFATNALAALAATVLVSILLLNWFWISLLVHIACLSIAMHIPHAPAEIVEPYADARTISFFNWALLGGGMVLIDLVLLQKLISCWSRCLRHRIVFVVLLAVSIALTAIHPIWVARRGLKDTSPCFAEVLMLGPQSRWYFAALLVALFSTAAARRLIDFSVGSARYTLELAASPNIVLQ